VPDYRTTTDIAPCSLRVGFTMIWTSCPSAVRNSIKRPMEKIARAVAHQRGDVGLLDAEEFTSLCLRQPALFDDLIDL
jgi:hypothetical protein